MKVRSERFGKMLGGGRGVLKLSFLLLGVHVGCAMFNYRVQPVNNNRFALNINRNVQGRGGNTGLLLFFVVVVFLFLFFIFSFLSFSFFVLFCYLFCSLFL